VSIWGACRNHSWWRLHGGQLWHPAPCLVVVKGLKLSHIYKYMYIKHTQRKRNVWKTVESRRWLLQLLTGDTSQRWYIIL
jgi:hypothetical protein